MTGEPAPIGAIAAIVLAGGRARRFGGNKLAVGLADGRSILAHSVGAVTALAGEVAVVLAPGAEAPLDIGAGLRVVHDPEAYGGPLIGLLAGLEAVAGEVVLVVGGDMPEVEPAVLRLLAETVTGDAAVEAARLEVPPAAGAGGLVDRPSPLGGVPLPCAVRRDAAMRACREALAAGDRRLRGCLERLATTVVTAGAWRALDPGGRTLLDIDAPADLAGLDGSD